jgi:hypothetical protein
VAAVERISEIRARRQERHYEKRMARVKASQVAADKQQLEREIHLVKAPAALRADTQAEGAAHKEKLRVAAEPLRDGQQQQQQQQQQQPPRRRRGAQQQQQQGAGAGDAMQE